MRKLAALTSIALLLAACSGGGSPTGSPAGTASAEKVTLTLQSWRVEDAEMWNTKIIPAFTKDHPNIEIKYDPSATNEYDAVLESRMQGGTAGDLFTLRPFEVTRDNIKKGYLAQLDDLDGLNKFEADRFDAWSIFDGHKYGVPMAAVQGNFFYNKAIFSEYNLSEPKTQADFLQVLKTIKDGGKYQALAYGSADAWVLSAIGIDIIGPNYWRGEEGRQGLLDGTKKFTDPDFVAAFDAFGEWRPYLPEGQASLTYADQTQLFALGKAAIWPTGSWSINDATSGGFEVGAFAPPLPKAGDDLFVQVHPDIAIGVNANSKHPAEARAFAAWLTSDAFIEIFTNSLPGFFSLRNDPPPFTNTLAQALQDIAASAKGWTPRLTQDRLSAGTPSLEVERQAILQKFMGTPSMTGADVAAELQKVLDASYTPPAK